MGSSTLLRRTIRMLLHEGRTTEQSENDINKGTTLLELAADLCDQYIDSNENSSVIELAIKYSTDSMKLLPLYHPDYFLTYQHLSACLFKRLQAMSGSKQDLEMAITYGIESVKWCPSGHPKQIYAFSSLARGLLSRFVRHGDRRDLEFSMMYHREAMALVSENHPKIDEVLTGFGDALLLRHHEYGDLKDLQDSIKCYRQALSQCPTDHHAYRMRLIKLANALNSQFLYHANPVDMDEAIAHAEEALILCPPTHSYRSSIFSCLAESFRLRFDWSGDSSDLDMAFKHGFQALHLLPVGHPRRSSALIAMAYCFRYRQQLYGMLSDTDTAINYCEEVLLLCLPGHASHAPVLIILGGCLFGRFTEEGSEDDLLKAMQCFQQVLLHPSRHLARCHALTSSADCLRVRFEQHGDIADLQLAISRLNESCDIIPPYHIEVLSSLAMALLRRYEALHNEKDLNLALDHLHNAWTRSTPGHYQLLDIYQYFAAAYIAKHSVDQDPFHQEQAISYYKKAVSHIPGGLNSRLKICLEWIVYAHAHQHPSELDAYRVSLTLLDQYFMVTPHVFSRHEIHKKKVPPTLAADAASCAIATGQLEAAVELLEYGRALLWTQLTRIRAPLDVLRDRGENEKRLAEEFTRLSRQLERSNMSATMQADSGQSDSIGTYSALARQWDVVVEEIRKVDGFSNFLTPSPFSELQIAAAEGPVIILNVGFFRSDAVIISMNGAPRMVPLSLTMHEVHQMSVEFRNIFRIFTGRGQEEMRGSQLIPLLRNLWNKAVHPVVRELRRIVRRGSRIWWCATSNLSSLPIHAAGPYCDGKHNLQGLYVSSYTPTLSALIRARREQASARSFLAIGQPVPYEGFGHGELQTVEEELNIIERLCPPSMDFSRLYGPAATFDAAMDGMKRHNWIHLACHGNQDAENPYESCFAMGDKPLRLLDIMQARLEDPQFAFLSACHTAVGDVNTPDEVIHLAAGLQFSGFRSVIGTIGAVDDGVVVRVVEEFYKNIFAKGGRSTDAARALSRTTNMLYQQGLLPFDQKVIFVHIGA